MLSSLSCLFVGENVNQFKHYMLDVVQPFMFVGENVNQLTLYVGRDKTLVETQIGAMTRGTMVWEIST